MAGPNDQGIADDAADYEDFPEGEHEQPQAAPPTPVPLGQGISEDSGLYEDVIAQSSEDALKLESRWLYKLHGEVFGPVRSTELLERLYAGELDAESEIAPEDGDFMALRRYGAFRAHLPKVSEHLAAAREVAKAEAAATRARLLHRMKFVAAAGLAGIAVFVVTRLVIRGYRSEQVATQQEETLRNQYQSLLASVLIEPPLIEIAEEPEPDPKSRPGKRPSRKRSRRSVARFSGGSTVKSTGKPGSELSRQEIMGGVATVFGGFKRCIVKQMQRDRSSVPNQIVLTFTIGNDGTVKDPSLHDRFLRREPIAECMGGHIRSVRYRTFNGEVRNVDYPITISSN